MKVRLTFVLDEDVDPDIFASKVALACGKGYALRPGEGIVLPSNAAKILRIGTERIEWPPR
jgi:hypothetical protein